MATVRSFLTGGGSNACVQFFDIRTESDQIVFQGPEGVASDAVFKGTLVVCNTEPLKTNGINLKLVGTRHTASKNPTLRSEGWRFQNEDVFRQDWTFETSGENKHLLQPGNHEWPFEVTLPAGLPESVEGRHLYWIVYRIKATIDRGVFAKNLEARRHIRLIRTPGPDSLELVYGASLEKIWPDKLKYEISTTRKAVTHGSTISVMADLVPLIKGLRIGTMTTSLMEQTEVTIETKGEPPRCRKESSVITKDEFDLPEDEEVVSIGGAEGYRIERDLRLPIVLRECLQDVDTRTITVTHSLKFNVQLHNPAGHTSELRVELPIKIYIPPTAIIIGNEVLGIAEVRGEDSNAITGAPPNYGSHQHDILYTDIDPQTYATPGPSRLPSRNHSRRPSYDASTSPLQPAATGAVSANTLETRLTNLRTGSVPSPPAVPVPILGSSYSPPHNGGGHFSGDSRTPSGSHTPVVELQDEPNVGLHGDFVPLAQEVTHEHVEWPMDELNRVPSYNTAVRASVATTPAAEASSLPHYGAATSRPTSRPPSPAV